MADPFSNDPFDDSGIPDAVDPNSLDSVDPFSTEPAKSDDFVILTNEQKKKALDLWNSGVKGTKEIIVAVLGEGYDGRTKEGIAIKKYLASLNMAIIPAQTYVRKIDNFILSDEQKEYIRQHSAHSKPLELARELFDNPNLTNLNVEVRAVVAFYESLDVSLRLVKAASSDQQEEYTPPRTNKLAIERINKYVVNGIDIKKMTKKEEGWLTSLIKYTHIHQYIYTIQEIQSPKDKELFESAYIRFTYDKPDLSEEELSLYISWCSDIVSLSRLQRELEHLTETRNSLLEENNGKISPTIVDAITSCYDEINNNMKRQKSISDSLQGKRADKIAKKNKSTASLVQLVDMWKEEDKRNQIIQLAEARRQRVAEEIDRLSSMDDLHFQLWGVSKEELV